MFLFQFKTANQESQKKGSEKTLSNADIIKKNAMRLEQSYNFLIKKAAECNVLLIGEIPHYQTKMDYFIAALLPALKKMGYDYYVMEASTTGQPFVDKYLKGEIGIEKLQRKVSADTADIVFEKCKQLGIKIVYADARPSAVLSRLPAGTKVQTENERFAYINSAVPENAKMIIHFGGGHTTYAYGEKTDPNPESGVTLPTMGQLFKNKHGDKAYSICFAEVGFVVLSASSDAWKKEGGIETRHFDDRQFDVYPRQGLEYFRNWNFMVNMEFEGKYKPPKTRFFH